MKRYFRFYRALIKMNFFRIITYRLDSLNSLVGSILWGIFSVVALYALTANSTSVFGWTRAELFVLIGVFNIIVGSTFRLFCARNFDKMPFLIQHGELDSMLLKPIDSQFALSFTYIDLQYIIRILLAVIYTVFMLSFAHVQITFLSLFSFIGLAFLGLIVMYGAWFLVMTLTIWFPDIYNIVEILYATDNITRYPPQIINELKLFVFYLIFPFTIAVSTPAKALLHKATIADTVILFITAFALLMLSRIFWKFALRYYTSASG